MATYFRYSYYNLIKANRAWCKIHTLASYKPAWMASETYL